MGILEFLMLFCFGFSWPFSIMKSLKSRSTKGKSIMFMVLVELGYVFGLANKILYNRDWVTWTYAALFVLVGVDIALYVRNWIRESRERERPGDGQDVAGAAAARR